MITAIVVRAVSVGVRLAVDVVSALHVSVAAVIIVRALHVTAASAFCDDAASVMFGDNAALAGAASVLDADLTVAATSFDGLDVAIAVGGLDGRAGAAFDFTRSLDRAPMISVRAAIVGVVSAVRATVVGVIIVGSRIVAIVVVVASFVGAVVVVIPRIIGAAVVVIVARAAIVVGGVVALAIGAVVIGRSVLRIVGRGTSGWSWSMSLRSWMRGGWMRGGGFFVVGRG